MGDVSPLLALSVQRSRKLLVRAPQVLGVAPGGSVIRLAGRKDNGTPFVILGLEPQNMSRLRDGQPIQINLRHLDLDGAPIEQLPDLDLVILFAGRDEKEMLLKKFGGVSPITPSARDGSDG